MSPPAVETALPYQRGSLPSAAGLGYARAVRLSLAALMVVPAVAAGDEPEVTHITVVTSVTATSTLASKNPSTYAAARVLDLADVEHDMPPSSAWCEGKPDEGIGEGVTLAFAAPAKIKEVVLRAGFWKTEKLFRANNIVIGVELRTDDGRKKAVSLPAKPEPVTVALGGGPVRELTVSIAKVKKGKMNDSCLSGVEVHTEPESVLVLGMDPALAAAIPRAERALARCDAKQLSEVVAFPFSWAPLYGEDGDRENQGEHRVTYATAAAMATACKDEEDRRATPHGRVPGVDATTKGDVVYLTDGSCGAECLQWGFTKKAGGWKLVWAGPVWVEPKP